MQLIHVFLLTNVDETLLEFTGRVFLSTEYRIEKAVNSKKQLFLAFPNDVKVTIKMFVLSEKTSVFEYSQATERFAVRTRDDISRVSVS